jgi:hypothetical protein
MKNTMKILSLSLLTTTLLMGSNSELYKMSSSIEMLNANQASSNTLKSIVYSNPANINNISKEEGFKVNILNTSISGSASIQDFTGDMTDALDTNETNAILNVIDSYNGENFNINADTYFGIFKNSNKFSWGVGLLGSTHTNIQPHNGGTNGFIEMSNRNITGVNLNIGTDLDKYIDLDNKYGNFSVGLGVKVLKSMSYRMNLSPTELLDNQDDLATYIADNYLIENTYFTTDIGMNYEKVLSDIVKVKLGLSINNIGTADSATDYSRIPTTVNTGISVSTLLSGKYSYLNNVTVSIDYNDMFNNNSMYSVDGTNIIVDEDTSVLKRINADINLKAYDSSIADINLNTGIYQGNIKYGVEARLLALKMGFASYTEEIGPETDLLEDTRYIFNIGIAW